MMITDHAAERYVQRVRPGLSIDQARAEIRASAKAIETAIRFGSTSVILGCGARLILCGDRVVTVLGRDQRDRMLMRRAHYGGLAVAPDHVALCGGCDRRADDPEIPTCTSVRCPMRIKEAS